MEQSKADLYRAPKLERYTPHIERRGTEHIVGLRSETSSGLRKDDGSGVPASGPFSGLRSRGKPSLGLSLELFLAHSWSKARAAIEIQSKCLKLLALPRGI